METDQTVACLVWTPVRQWFEAMTQLTRVTRDPDVMGGRPCIRGLRITVGTVVGLVAAGRTIAEILEAYPYLEAADIREAQSYAAASPNVGGVS